MSAVVIQPASTQFKTAIHAFILKKMLQEMCKSRTLELSVYFLFLHPALSLTFYLEVFNVSGREYIFEVSFQNVPVLPLSRDFSRCPGMH